MRKTWGRPEAVWVGGLLLLLLSGFYWLPGSGEARSDSFSASASGKKAFFSLAQRLIADVRRNTGKLQPPEDATTLCLIGPARYPAAREWQQLHQWVQGGGTLVFVARYEDPVVDLGPFRLKVVHRLKNAASDPDEDDSPDSPGPAEQTEGSGPGALEVDPHLAEGEFNWPSAGWVQGASPDAWVAVALFGLPQVVFQEVGEGEIVVVASDALFTNAALLTGDNGLVAFRILEYADAGGPLYFDETLNASGPPKVFGLLFDPPLRPMTLQALMVVLLFGWWGSRRFGPVTSLSPLARRDITEHAVALGNLHFKVGTGGRLVASYLERFRHRLRLNYLASAGQDVAGALARRARVDIAAAKSALGLASRTASQERVPTAQAAAAVRALARIGEKLRR
jgi:hypothetical protein